MSLFKQLQEISETEHRYLVEIQFNDRILAGKPLQKDMISGMVRAQLKRKALKEKKDPDAVITDALVDELVAKEIEHLFGGGAEEAIEDAERLRTNVFESTEIGPHIGTYQVKACLNDCLTTLGITQSKRGSKQTMQHATVILACDESGIPVEGSKSGKLYFFDANNVPIEDTDGIIEICGHVIDKNGPRSILKSSEYMFQRKTRFLIVTQCLEKSRKKAEFVDEDVCKVLNSAQHNGIGAVRKLGYGKFRVTRLEKIQGDD